MTQLFGEKLSPGKPLTSTKLPTGLLTPYRLTVPCGAGRDGGGPPDADDLARSEGGWGVPVQPVREAGELGGEWSNRAEVESQPKKDYGRVDNPVGKPALPRFKN